MGQITGLPSDRYQIHFPSNQFKNQDQYGSGGTIPIVEWLNGKWSEFKEIFKPEFTKGFIKPNTNFVEIVYPGSIIGNFVALYGFEEVFNLLPDTITKLHIINTSNENITLKIPESISRFKSLSGVMFKNIIDSLPNSICELKELTLISCSDNKELKTVPECIANLPKILFMNFMKCPNLKFPKSFETLESNGDGSYTTWSDSDD